ncbi:phospholipid transport system substrate-binding protein [Loktanella ponticola]|uniref:Phospholipid transport system substrate-binding protein n=1 Tax=Yoonia ponticola TaxID=1524255 RepID=A0A7W9EYP1_9RHOB|nr:ABC transporter substrate-binding protein [Yoonia ponticola]MBB5723008.1 phospholipid transport system substrate-binding protein [Yoonia ponticola]
MLNRRQVIIAAASASILPQAAAALSVSESQSIVAALVTEVNAVIASGKSEAAMISDFAVLFDRYSDVPTIARYCLGADARSASPAQMQAYTAAFRGYIASKYGRRFREFVGGEIIVEGAAPVKSWIEVETTVQLRGRSPLRMDFHVSDRSGSHKFFNFIIEGVNMLLTERAEIGALLDRQGRNLDALTAEIGAV